MSSVLTEMFLLLYIYYIVRVVLYCKTQHLVVTAWEISPVGNDSASSASPSYLLIAGLPLAGGCVGRFVFLGGHAVFILLEPTAEATLGTLESLKRVLPWPPSELPQFPALSVNGWFKNTHLSAFSLPYLTESALCHQTHTQRFCSLECIDWKIHP